MGYYQRAALDAPVYVGGPLPAAAGAQLAQYIFTSDGYYEIEAVTVNHDVNGGAGATIDLVKCATGTTPASGVSTLGSTFALSAGADTSQTKTRNAGQLSSTLSRLSLIPGDSLAVVYAGTLTGLLGVACTVRLRRTRANF
jgi:hypothetical protein